MTSFRERLGSLGRVEWLDWLVRDPRTGERVLWQAPNLPSVLWSAGQVAARVAPAGRPRDVAEVVRTGAAIWWSADELLRGVTPLRRLTGAAVLAAQVVRVVRLARR